MLRVIIVHQNIWTNAIFHTKTCIFIILFCQTNQWMITNFQKKKNLTNPRPAFLFPPSRPLTKTYKSVVKNEFSALPSKSLSNGLAFICVKTVLCDSLKSARRKIARERCPLAPVCRCSRTRRVNSVRESAVHKFPRRNIWKKARKHARRAGCQPDADLCIILICAFNGDCFVFFYCKWLICFKNEILFLNKFRRVLVQFAQ